MEYNTTGILRKNEGARYEVKGGCEFSSGSYIEFYNADSNSWVQTSIEYKDNDYYLVGYENIEMQGLKVRA